MSTIRPLGLSRCSCLLLSSPPPHLSLANKQASERIKGATMLKSCGGSKRELPSPKLFALLQVQGCLVQVMRYLNAQALLRFAVTCKEVYAQWEENEEALWKWYVHETWFREIYLEYIRKRHGIEPAEVSLQVENRRGVRRLSWKKLAELLTLDLNRPFAARIL